MRHRDRAIKQMWKILLLIIIMMTIYRALIIQKFSSKYVILKQLHRGRTLKNNNKRKNKVGNEIKVT